VRRVKLSSARSNRSSKFWGWFDDICWGLLPAMLMFAFLAGGPARFIVS